MITRARWAIIVAESLVVTAVAVTVFGYGFAVWPFGPHPWRTILLVGGIAFAVALGSLRDRHLRG